MDTSPVEITVDMCLAGRDLTEPRPAPDGSTVAFVVRWGGVSAITTVPADGGPERLVTTEPQPAPGRGFGGGCFAWLPDAAGFVYAARDGDLWYQPVPGGAARRVSSVGEGRRCEAPAVAPDGRTVAAIVDQAEVWCWPLAATGPGRGERIDDGTDDFVFDPAPLPHRSGPGWIWQAWSVPDMPWDASRARIATRAGDRWALDEYVPAAAIQQLGHLPDGRGLAVRDDTGWLNVWAGDRPLVDEPYEHAGPTWGPGQRSYAASATGDRVAFTRNVRGFGRLCVVTVATGAVTEVARGVHGQLGWVGERLTALRSGARTPTQVVAYDTATRERTWERTMLAIGPVAGFERADLPEPELVAVDVDVDVDGRTGGVVHARRYVAGNGRTLCWVHGGPTDQWRVEFLARVAYWWSQGWDVLVPDPRGSTGHGRAYQQALRGEWGRLDVADAAAVLAHSHRLGWSTPERTVVIGSSSGGLTALGVLAHHGELAAGGVVLYPVADLAALAAESHRFEAHYTLSLVGPLEDRATYAARSPITWADRIEVPLLVMHGDADPVVPLRSTVELVARMRAAGGDVELVVMEGEGHGFRDPANKRADYDLTGAFLARVVGPV